MLTQAQHNRSVETVMSQVLGNWHYLEKFFNAQSLEEFAKTIYLYAVESASWTVDMQLKFAQEDPRSKAVFEKIALDASRQIFERFSK